MNKIREIPRFPIILDDKKIIGVGDLLVSNMPSDILVTFSLGSCVAVAIYDPVAQVGGILHAMLPDAEIALNRDDFHPFKYVSTGLPILFKECYRLGALKHRIRVKMAGCSNVLDGNNFFNIGQRNYAAVRKSLWKNNVLIDAEYCQTNESITMFLHIADGRVILKIRNSFYLLGDS